MTLSFTHSVDVAEAASGLADCETDEVVVFLVRLAESLGERGLYELVDEVRQSYRPDRLAVLGLCQALADAAREGGAD